MSLIRSIARGAALAPLLAASACAVVDEHPRALTPTEQFAPRVDTAPERLALAVHPQGGLSSAQTAALADFAARWRQGGGGVIVIRAPDGANGDQAQSMLYYVCSALESFGVPATAIRRDRYAPDGSGPAPVLASFDRLQVVVPDCARQWTNLSSTGGNQVYGAFGCAVTSNIAMQVADPRDLVSPAPLAAGDNIRRETVLSKYRDGKITSSEKDVQASGVISSAINQ